MSEVALVIVVGIASLPVIAVVLSYLWTWKENVARIFVRKYGIRFTWKGWLKHYKEA